MHINEAGLDILKRYEGCRLQSYDDANGNPLYLGDVPKGIATIGFGTILDVKAGDRITQAEADAFLRRDLTKFEHIVDSLITVDLNENQFSALVCLAYNCGSAPLKKTLGTLLNEGKYSDAAEEFTKWNKYHGQVSNGLVKRRAAERELFLREPS